MTPSVLLVVGAVVAKVASVGWLASIATSPVAVESRRRFLEVNKKGLENLFRLGMANETGYQSLLKDFERLEATVEKGWDTPELFAAASRVSSWKFFEHTYGALSGISRLTSNTANAGFDAAHRTVGDWLDALDKRIDSVFAPAPVKENDSDHRHRPPQ